jgi:hypothetical protein
VSTWYRHNPGESISEALLHPPKRQAPRQPSPPPRAPREDDGEGASDSDSSDEERRVDYDEDAELLPPLSPASREFTEDDEDQGPQHGAVSQEREAEPARVTLGEQSLTEDDPLLPQCDFFLDKVLPVLAAPPEEPPRLDLAMSKQDALLLLIMYTSSFDRCSPAGQSACATRP